MVTAPATASTIATAVTTATTAATAAPAAAILLLLLLLQVQSGVGFSAKDLDDVRRLISDTSIYLLGNDNLNQPLRSSTYLLDDNNLNQPLSTIYC